MADSDFTDGWNPEKALKDLLFEKAMSDMSTQTPQQLAKRLFEEKLPISVMAICHIATYSDSEVMRFNAAKYVVERTMGPAERKENAQDGPRVWDAIYDKVTVGAEQYLKAVAGDDNE